MTVDVLCLRPEADFLRAGASPPPALKVAYRAPEDPDVPSLMRQARALVIPAVGPKLAPALFQNASIEFVQITGAGLDRLDLPLLKQLGIAVANVPGGSNQAVAEYVVTAASVLLRRSPGPTQKSAPEGTTSFAHASSSTSFPDWTVSSPES